MNNTTTKGLQSALVSERRKRQAAETEAWMRKAYTQYRAQGHKSIEADILSATKAGFAGSGYSLILAPDRFSVQWDGAFNRSLESGVVIGLPHLSDDDWDNNEEEHFYDNAIEALDLLFEQAVEEQRYAILNQ